MLANGDVTGAAAKAAEAMAAARSLSFPFPMALCLETAALVALHPAMTIRPGASGPVGRISAAGGGRATEPAVTGLQARIEASGRLLAAASAIRERGNRACPVPLSAAIARARLAAPPSRGPAVNPAEAAEARAADEAAALLASLTAPGQIRTLW